MSPHMPGLDGGAATMLAGKRSIDLAGDSLPEQLNDKRHCKAPAPAPGQSCGRLGTYRPEARMLPAGPC